MKNTFVVLSRHFARMICAGMLLGIASTVAVANDNCQRLEALDRQYRGVALTTDQKSLKHQLVAWYKENCGQARRASAEH